MIAQNKPAIYAEKVKAVNEPVVFIVPKNSRIAITNKKPAAGSMQFGASVFNFYAVE